jgi:hypothetical protein
MAALGLSRMRRRSALPALATFTRPLMRAPVSALLALAMAFLYSTAGVAAPHAAGTSFSFSDSGTDCGLCFSNPLVGEVRCGEAITCSTTVTNCGASPVSELTAVVQGDLLSGCGETLPVSVALSSSTVPVGGSIGLEVQVSVGKPKACTYTGVIQLGEGCTVDMQVTVLPCPEVGLPQGQIVLACSLSETVVLTNLGNTDLSLSACLPGRCPVRVTPDPIILPYGESASVTLEAICAGLSAGLHCGDVPLADDSLGYSVSLPVCVDVSADSCVSVALPSPPPQVSPGEAACLKIPVTNCGNFPIPAGQALVTMGDFISPLPGSKYIPCGGSGHLEQELPIGATDTLTVCVPVAAGTFCGTYCAPLTIPAGAGVGSATEICFVVAGCADRPIAFSVNPVRYSLVKQVTIATTSVTPVSVKIYSMQGLLVRTLEVSGSIAWDLKNDDGDLVASGMYIVSVDTGGTVYREKLLFLK